MRSACTFGASISLKLHHNTKCNSPAVQILDGDAQAQVLRERDDVQLLALLAHRLDLAPAVGGHVQVQPVRQEGEEPLPVLPQVACDVWEHQCVRYR